MCAHAHKIKIKNQDQENRNILIKLGRPMYLDKYLKLFVHVFRFEILILYG